MIVLLGLDVLQGTQLGKAPVPRPSENEAPGTGAADPIDALKGKVSTDPDARPKRGRPVKGLKEDKNPAKDLAPEHGALNGAPPEPLDIEALVSRPGDFLEGDQTSRHEDVTDALTAPEPTPPAPAKEALELKERMIEVLQNAFRAGKVDKVRAVLSKYGNGAKSFREIDIEAFPVIEKVVSQGALG
jgi:hypothetical protein